MHKKLFLQEKSVFNASQIITSRYNSFHFMKIYLGARNIIILKKFDKLIGLIFI